MIPLLIKVWEAQGWPFCSSVQPRVHSETTWDVEDYLQRF